MPAPAPAPAADLWFGGDVHFGASLHGGLGDIVPILAGARGIVNLEGPVAAGSGGADRVGETIVLANPSDAPARLARLGVVAVSVANNHASDAGEAGIARTRAALGAAGVAVAGEGPVELGPDLSLFAYDLEDAAVPARLATDLDATRGRAIVSLHVTGPASYLPRPELRAAVDAALAHGADIVVAHGTHVVGPVERRGGALIAWGLGNLFFDCPCTTDDEAILLRVSLAPGLPATIVPIRAGLGSRDPALASDPEGLFNLLEGLGSSPLRRRGPVADW